ncbi:hypothetical protein KZX50_00505 [Bacillus infantis]|uniref:hypothetical protein n=1 Tax=Bacillus infantis TaxID=324767 RepID=UPI0020039D95|nr:hypothetical protein [Bacillus infantis]MCK6203928.1 hypothetical protein [Bacillus infantis]
MATYRWRKYDNGPVWTLYRQSIRVVFEGYYKRLEWDNLNARWVNPPTSDSSNYWQSANNVSYGDAYFYAPGSSKITKGVAQEAGLARDNLLVNEYQAEANSRSGKGEYYYGEVTSTSRTAYPDNGVSGAFYYEYAGVVNTAPTTPGTFTSPITGSVLKGGQTVTFAFGASSDAEGNPITYYPEYRYYKNGVAQAWNTLTGSTARSRDLTLTTDKTMNKIEFRVRAYDGQAYSAYRQSATYDIIHNTAPTFNLSTVDNQVLFTNDVLTISGSASDADVGNAISVKYQIDNGTVRTAFTTKTTDTNPIPFSTDLTLIDGKLTENGVPVTDALAEEVTYMLKVWVEDDQGGKSSILTRNFQVILNKKPVITVISSVYPDFIWEVSDEDGTIVRSSFIVNDNELMRIPNPTEQLKYTLTPGKLVFGSNLVVIEAEDNLGAVTQRKFNVTMERVRIPETQLKANLSAETVKEVLLTMKREDAAENIKITRIVGGIG